ncbi:MAG: type IX secretion system membrane protein PorP/SprF [Saprospiraceae bacterium]|nr:type IX secretion system membrane protein PorP/SprF [Saprospiraceae bacterium]
MRPVYTQLWSVAMHRSIASNTSIRLVAFGLLLSLFLYSNTTFSQDIHLSHIHASPTHLNPAMTGLFNADLRFIANYKGQWNSFTNGYRTMVASADMKLNKGIGNRDDVGVGIMAIGDQAGDLKFRTLNVGLSVSYLKALNATGTHFLSAGIQTGIIQQRLNTSLAILEEEFDPYIQNPDFMGTVSAFDLSAGLAWFVPVGRRNHVYLGASMWHINRGFVAFQQNQVDAPDSYFLFPKTVIHGGAHLRINYVLTLKPSFIFLDQGPHREINMGTFFSLQAVDQYVRPEYTIYFGAWFRWSMEEGEFNRDALIASVRYDWKNTIFTFSYDINISDLARASRYQGGPELSIIHYIDFFRTDRLNFKVKCPEF